MAEFSGFWTTGGSTGHQQTSYTQAQMGIASKIYAACSGYQGVAPGYLNQLSGAVTAVNTAQINTGGAMVDGHWFNNDAAKNVDIPSAVGSGNTRIDRIVVRCTHSGYIVQITRIAGTDAAEPTPPAITQNSGSVYDIKLYQALVDTAGNVQLTDERDWALLQPGVDDVTIETANSKLQVKDGGIGADKIASNAITTTKILNDAVTNAKLADPYDIVHLFAAEPTYTLVVEDGLITFPVPDVHNGKNIVMLKARLSGAASTSGDVTIRVYNVTKSLVVGTVTVTQGNTIGSTTSITNPGISENDVLRVDVTAAGTGAAGLDVQIKVDKT